MKRNTLWQCYPWCSRCLRLIITVLILASSAISSAPVSAQSADRTIIVDPAVHYQTVEGWGTSLAWWADKIGWSDADRNKLADEIFAASGLHLNIMRYNIGGGENPDYNYLQPRRKMPGFQSADGTWDWSADANQRWMLHAAQARGATFFEAFANSPPYWMTNSGSVSGADGGGDNLDPDHYDNFAHYLTEVVKHYRDTWGVSFQTLSPFNEPDSGWGDLGDIQEGCRYQTSTQNTMIERIAAQLDEKGLDTAISASEVTNINNATAAFNDLSSTAKAELAQINVHTYGGDKRAAIRELAVQNNRRLWLTEIGMGGSETSMTPGLALSREILLDMKTLQSPAFVYWQVVEPEELDATWGMIHAYLDGTNPGWYEKTKQYYVMGQYSKFIRPGYRVIGVTDSGALAAWDAHAQKLTIVATNSSTSETTLTYDLSRFGTITGSVTPYRTSANENLKQLSNITLSNKTFTATLPANSVTTFVVSGVSATVGSILNVNNNTTGTGANQFNYSGSWSYGSQSGAYQSDNHWTGTSGRSFQVTFSGTQINLYGARSPKHGIALVSIDDQPAIPVDYYAATRTDNVLMYASPQLQPGTHTLKVEVTGRKNSVASGTVVTADRVEVATGNVTHINDNAKGSGTNQINYSGSWSSGSQTGAYREDNHWTSSSGRSFEISFSGTKINLYAAQASNNGIAAISIDGGTATNVDFYAPSRFDEALVYSSPVLANSTHTLRVEVTGTKNSASSNTVIPIDRIEVRSP